jgi:hypothetical protein
MLIFAFLLVAAFPAPAAAQDDAAPPRDPQALAIRFLGASGAAPTSPLTPIYRAGDTLDFWVTKTGSDTPVRVSATLVAATPILYMWVEDGISADTDGIADVALQLSRVLFFYRMRTNFREAPFLPSTGEIMDFDDLLALPDVDADEHLYVLYTTDLPEQRETVRNPIDSLPVEYASYSNQHELLYVNMTPYPDRPLADPVFASMIVRGIYRLVMNTNFPQQAAWLTESLNWSLLFAIQDAQVPAESITAFLEAPDTPLLQAGLTNALLGSQQMFLLYLQQRYGGDIYRDLFMQEGAGIATLDAVLAANAMSDPATGAPVTGRDAFADFVMTNTLNFAFGDRRYVHSLLQLENTQRSSANPLTPPVTVNGLTVSQFGTQVYAYSAEAAETVSVHFDGDPTISRLPMNIEYDPANRYYWSGRTANSNPTLTRPIDLSGVESATLTFDAWYNLTSSWNYGYVSASSDGGATWQPLAASTTRTDNPYGVAYGVGFTGISAPSPDPVPFPALGVTMASDGVTILETAADGAAAAAGMQAGDTLIGYDGQVWERIPNILVFLSNFAPGETVNFRVQRGDEQLDIPVELRQHPTRLALPLPGWMAQTIDLSAYAGQEILLRFETVTLPEREDNGFAIDNLAIAEIGWTDDAEGDATGWTLEGWTQVDNRLPQQWIVQAATSGGDTSQPRVQRLIDYDDDIKSGSWRFALGAGESLLITVSAANDDTSERATFTLGVERE